MSELNPIRILLIDDHFVVRSGLVASLGMEPNLEVVGEAESGEEGLELSHSKDPGEEDIAERSGKTRERGRGKAEAGNEF